MQRDAEELRLRAAEGVVESLLPVIDNMQRALDAAAKHEEGQLIAGVELVADQLQHVLSSHGLEELPTEPGTSFDPNVHEAVLTQPSAEFEEGTVLSVLERATCCTARLLRPAKVIVVAVAMRDFYQTLGVPKNASPGRGQEGVPQAGAPAPPGQEPGRQDGGGEVQGGQRPTRRSPTPRSASSTTR